MERFNYQSFLTYIVLAIIVAVTIQLLFKMVSNNDQSNNNKTKELMENQLLSCGGDICGPNNKAKAASQCIMPPPTEHMFYPPDMAYGRSDGTMDSNTI